ncbi:hypothetical protein GCM10027052_13740 [Parafrigoribacterium mesophilum]|uniref:hypothetical protein n=1 Tax=Parafrigoribacterium mesophilum TaxID=433646 RepID=UPI0031FBBF7B
MDDDPDAEALSWGAETDPTHVDAPDSPPAVARRPGPAAGTGSLLLVGYGVFAGVYLLYTIGWFGAVLRNTLTLAGLIPEVMYQFGEFLAIVAPALWFGAVLLLTRGRRPLTRVLWLLVGMVVLVPWPMVVGR